VAIRQIAGALALALAGGAGAQDEPAALPLRAGAALVKIETPEGAPLAGYSDRGPGNRHQGELAPVEARALVMAGAGGRPRVGLVVIDILIVTPTLREAIRERAAPLELDGLIVAATHTHSGPGGYVESWVGEAGLMGWYDAAVLRALTAAAGSALEYATRALAPAAVGVAIASSPSLAENRRHPGGPTDPSIPVLRVDGASGVAIATLFSLAAHPTILRPDNASLSPDYPGAARARIEAERGGVALFVAGPLGDQKPRSTLPAGADASARERSARELGERLGTLVVQAAELASPASDAPVGFAEIRFPPPPIDVRGACAGWVFAPLFHIAARLTLASESVLAAARFGGLRVLASPYELGVEVAARIRSRVAGPLMLIAHANDWLGYLLEPADFEAGGYESCLAFHGDQAAPPFADAAVQVLESPALSDPR
jgi:neutral ceramidase